MKNFFLMYIFLWSSSFVPITIEFVSNSLYFLSKRVEAIARRVSILKVALKDFYFYNDFKNRIRKDLW